MQLGSPYLTQKFSTVSLGNHLFWGQKIKSEGHKAQKNIAGVGNSALVSAGFF